MESIDTRKITLEHWLAKQCGISNVQLHAIPGDAGFRRYFRIQTPKGSAIAMDAANAHENCQAFINIANALRPLGVTTPEIFAADLSQGLLLISDFGDATYLKTLNSQNADALYDQALNTLALLQHCQTVPGQSLPPFDPNFMWQEWAWHKEWFLDKFLHLTIPNEKKLDQCYQVIVDSATTQPQAFMHRDYHSANLMVLANGTVGVLDFQDAFHGPLTYDLVSLLRDCYINWPAEWVERTALLYLKKLQAQQQFLHVQPNEFLRWFDLMGIQRHLKALLTFARKHVRDQQSNYLRHIPRTMEYLLTVSANYPELADLNAFLHHSVKPALDNNLEKIYLCAQ